MPEWEYISVKTRNCSEVFEVNQEQITPVDNLPSYLAMIGLGGWEMVGVTSIDESNVEHCLFFKRQLS